MSREALVVGINRYPFLKDNPKGKPKHLSLPAADAEAVAQVLERYGNFRVRRMPETYIDRARRVDGDPSPMKLTRVTDLQEEIALLFNPPSNVPDTALLYFAGHGLRSDHGGVEESFLATSDVNPKRGKWGLPFSWLRQLLQKSPVGQKLVWLDCCHSGELLDFHSAYPGAKKLGNMCLIAACRGFEVAYEEVAGTHGVLTEALLTALNPESNQKPWVTNYELVDYIKSSLAQTPQRPIYNNFGSEIVITGQRDKIHREILMEKVCPYKGLESFEEADAEYFYGRTALVDELLDRLRERERNFLAVVGASGSGKSSAVKAGLLHQLKLGQRLSGSDEWQIIIFRPGEHPLKSLVSAFGGAPDKFDFADGLNLAQLVRITGYPEVVLVADQFEEAFTLCQDLEVRQKFFACLLGAKDKPRTNLRVIITMRADFFGKCAESEYSGLAQHIQDNMVTVRPMNREELTEAIEQPAWKVELEVEGELTEQILSDLEGVPASLPLLQDSLRELWHNRKVDRLTLAEYTRLGGVKGTLQKRAENVFSSLDDPQQLAAKRIFLELIQLGEGTEDTRRQVLKKDLVKEDLPLSLVDVTVGKLVEEKARLLVTGELQGRGEGEKTVTAVDVAHEALILNWSRLRGWVNDNRDALRMQRQIQSEAQKWEMEGKSRGYLRSGAPLVEAQSYLKNYGELGLLSELGKEYITKSIRRQRRNRLLQISLGAVVLLSLSGLTIFSFMQMQEAQTLAKKNQIRADAGTVKNILATDPLKALTLAIKTTGLNLELSPEIEHYVQSSLRDAIVKAEENNIFEGHEDRVTSVAFSPEGKYIVSGSGDSTFRLWDLKGNPIGEPFRGHEEQVTSVAFSPDSKYIVSGSKDFTLRLWDIKGNPIGEPFRGAENYVKSVAFSPDGKYIVSGGVVNGYWIEYATESAGRIQVFSPFDRSDSKLRLWDILQLWDLNGNLIGEPLRGHDFKDYVSRVKSTSSVLYEVTSVAFSPDGKYIVSGGNDNTLLLWDIKGNLIGKPFKGHKGAVTSVVFSPDGKYIVSGSKDSTLRLWDLEGNPIGEPFGGDGKIIVPGHNNRVIYVTSVAFSPDGKKIVSGSEDGTLRLWDVPVKLNGVRVKGEYSGELIAFTSDRKYISVANRFSVFLLDIQGNTRDEHRYRNALATAGTRARAVWSPDGKYIIGGSSLISLEVLSIEDNVIREAFSGHEIDDPVAFSPDSKYIVGKSGDGTLRLWDLQGNAISEPFRGDTGGVNAVAFSPEGKYIVGKNGDGTLRLWDLQGNAISEPFRSDAGGVNAVAFSPEGKYIVGKNGDGTLQLWDLQGNAIGEPFRDIQQINSPTSLPVTYLGDAGGAKSLAFSPDGKYIVSGSEDFTLRLWNRWGNAIGEPFRGHALSGDPFRGLNLNVDYGVNSVAFSPDSKYIVSGSSDKTLRLWDLEGNSIGEPFRGHEDIVLSVVFSPDGKYIASIGQEGRLRLWRGGNWKDWLAEGCNMLQFHPVLAGPEPDEDASEAVATCQKHVWDDIEKAKFKMRQGWLLILQNQDVQSAVAKFDEAHKLDGTIDLEAKKKLAYRVAAHRVIARGKKLARDGKVKEALAEFAKAQELHPQLQIPAYSWNSLCWYGSLYDEVARVMDACDRAVALLPESGYYRAARGLARSQTGDTAGAIEDFEAYVKWSELQTQQWMWEKNRKQVQGWIDVLRKGENPFTEEVLKELRAVAGA